MIIEAKELSKIYGEGENQVVALDRASLTIAPGDLISIMGPSGSGKSTLLHLLSGLDRPTSGQLTYDGRDIYRLGDKELSAFRRRRIGFIFQQFHLLPVLTAWENIVMPLLLDKKQPDERYLGELAGMLGIGERLSHLPHELSGGQQQRVAIARALVKMPGVLLLDEPLSNLDARLRLQTREEIRRIQRETGITTVFVTHDQEEAMSISDRIVVMKEGVVQQIGKPQAVYDDPANLFVARFLGTPPINVFAGQCRGGRLYLGEDAVLGVSGIADQEVYVGVRPEGFVLCETGSLSCEFGSVEVMGRDISVVSRHGASLNPTVRSIISAENRVDAKDGTVRFFLKPQKVFLFRKETEERLYGEITE